MNEPQLLFCPKCSTQTANTSLGSITSQGYLIIRKHQRELMILSESYSVICDCGYAIRITHGIVQREKLSDLMNG